MLDELASRTSKADLVDALGSKLRKDELSDLVGDDDATKDELVKKLGSRKKDELVDAIGSHLTKDEVQRLLERHDEGSTRRDTSRHEDRVREDGGSERTPPFVPGERVRVDLSGLPMLGVFAGKGTSAAGTVVAVERERAFRVHLDAVFDGEKEIVLPPERIASDR